MFLLLAGLLAACSVSFCTNAAICMTEGVAVLDGGSPERAEGFFETACELGEGKGCLFQGLLYDGKGLPPDLPKAIGLMEKGCTLGDAQACFVLAGKAKAGVGVPQDNAEAVRLYDIGCSEWASACIEAGRLHIDGAFPGADVATGLAFMEKGCLMEDPTEPGRFGACAEVGHALYEGWAGTEDKERAMTFWTRACEGKVAVACRNLGVVEMVASNWLPSAEWYDRGCRLGDALACKNLGVLIQDGHVTSSEQTAGALFERACALGDEELCALLKTQTGE